MFSFSAIRKGNKDLRSKSFLVFYYIFEFAKNRMLSVAFVGSGRYIQGASIGVNGIKRRFVDLTYAKVSPMQMYALQGGATIKGPFTYALNSIQNSIFNEFFRDVYLARVMEIP